MKSKSFRLITCILLLLLICAFLFVCLFVESDRETDDTSESSTEPETEAFILPEKPDTFSNGSEILIATDEHSHMYFPYFSIVYTPHFQDIQDDDAPRVKTVEYMGETYELPYVHSTKLDYNIPCYVYKSEQNSGVCKVYVEKSTGNIVKLEYRNDNLHPSNHDEATWKALALQLIGQYSDYDWNSLSYCPITRYKKYNENRHSLEEVREDAFVDSVHKDRLLSYTMLFRFIMNGKSGDYYFDQYAYVSCKVNQITIEIHNEELPSAEDILPLLSAYPDITPYLYHAPTHPGMNILKVYDRPRVSFFHIEGRWFLFTTKELVYRMSPTDPDASSYPCLIYLTKRNFTPETEP